MAKSKPPYFCFYPNDFASDPKVLAMSAAGVGAYIRLLCAAWGETPPGSVPNDDRVLARLAGMAPDEWRDVRPEVVAAFEFGNDGRLHQKRLRQEYERFIEKSKKRAEAGQKGGQVANAKQMLSKSVARASDSDSDSESAPSGGGDSKGGEPPPGFLRWWKAYPNRTDRAKALAYWTGQKPLADGAKQRLEPKADEIIAAVEDQKRERKQRKANGEFVPEWKGAASWLYNARWLDEVESKQAKPPPDPLSQLSQDEYDRRVQQAWDGLSEQSQKRWKNEDEQKRAAMLRRMVKEQLEKQG